MLALLVDLALTTGPAGDYPAANLSILSHPLGNAHGTWTSLRVEGQTSHALEREFLLEYGLESNTGAAAKATPQRDKVTLYTSIVGKNGTGDIWSINPLLRQEPGSGEYTAQGIELDIDNMNAHRGDTTGAAGLAPPNTYGLSVTGAGTYRSTSAIAVFGAQHMWNRGVVGCANDAVVQSVFTDYCSAKVSLDIAGQPEWGVRQNSRRTRNLLRGATGVAIEPEDGFALHVGGSLLHSGLWLNPEPEGGRGTSTRKTLASVLHDAQMRGGGGRDGGIAQPNSSGKPALAAVERLTTTVVEQQEAENSQDVSWFEFGVDAASAAAALPQLTRRRMKDGVAVSSDGLVALLIEAVKEQQSIIAELQARVGQLESLRIGTAS